MLNQLFNQCVYGMVSETVSAVPMVRKQGNGNFTGFVRTSYSNGEVIDFPFVVNAKSEHEVARAYCKKLQIEAIVA